jgi:hypothetical protein
LVFGFFFPWMLPLQMAEWTKVLLTIFVCGRCRYHAFELKRAWAGHFTCTHSDFPFWKCLHNG